MARLKFYQRRYLVQKKFQGRFVLLYALLVTTIVSGATWVLYRRIEQAIADHLYRTHIKIEKVGDFLVGLLFEVNFYTIAVVVLAVLFVSLFIFQRINANFSRLENTIRAMSRGEFDHPYRPDQGFADIGELAPLLEQLRRMNRDRFNQVRLALDEIEAGLAEKENPEVLQQGRKRLVKAVAGLKLHECDPHQKQDDSPA